MDFGVNQRAPRRFWIFQGLLGQSQGGGKEGFLMILKAFQKVPIGSCVFWRLSRRSQESEIYLRAFRCCKRF